MKTSTIQFDELQRLLRDLGFSEIREAAGWRFEHRASGTLFLFRPYSLVDKVSMPDLVSTRMHLDWRGLLSASAFDDSFAKTPA